MKNGLFIGIALGTVGTVMAIQKNKHIAKLVSKSCGKIGN